MKDSDLMLIKLNDIRQIYRELRWDTQLLDQMNILAYSFGQDIFDRRHQHLLDMYANMSVFYHKQTDSCYMICQRSYYNCYLPNLDDVISQIKDYAEWAKKKLGMK